jgi:alkylation response protein AidB-like acyl-CoA dehydrogenase
MQFSFSNDQIEFAAGLREMLERELTAAHLREVWDGGEGHDPGLWKRLADMGVLGMMVGEPDGGLGGGFVDTILLVEELGRAGAPGPAFETMVVGALALSGTAHASGIADGSVLVTANLLGEPYVPHSTSATVALVRDGDAVSLVERPVFTADEIEGLDGGRRLGRLAAGQSGARLDVGVDMLTDAGALAAAAYLLGLSQRMLAIAGDYARDRKQFGQPIGSFQAVKHLMADALLKVEFARPAISRAAWSFTNDPANRARDVSMAKCLASDAAQKAARSALQVHGAIGYTWECDLQLFMKKAWALIPAWGNAQHHRRRVAAAVLA